MTIVKIDGRTLDVSSFMDRHPGGKLILKGSDGHDISALLHQVPHKHSEHALKLLNSRQFREVSISDEALAARRISSDFNTISPSTYNRWWVLPNYSVSNQNVRLLPRYLSFLEPLTYSPIWLLPLFYIPFIGFLFTFGLLKGATFPFLTFILAFLTWSLFEYITHRFIFHLVSDIRIFQVLQWSLHGNHHKFPHSKLRLTFPIVPALILFIIPIYLILSLFMSRPTVCMFLSGFLLHYLIYDVTHYCIHIVPESFWKARKWWYHLSLFQLIKRLRRVHMNHHYHDFTKNFAIDPFTFYAADVIAHWWKVFGGKKQKKQGVVKRKVQ
ncbi:hypothetical protein RCL1_002595 [Eukaryota sp. TZLM3-RCL]